MGNRFFKCFDIDSFINFCKELPVVEKTKIALLEKPLDIDLLKPEPGTGHYKERDKNELNLTRYDYRPLSYAYAR